MKVETTDFAEQADQVFRNIKAVTEAAGGSVKDIVKLNIYLTDLNNFAMVNEVMVRYFEAPFPARAAIGVAALPLGVQVEVEGVMVV
jgi:reactive intermediate/imine deaminase